MLVEFILMIQVKSQIAFDIADNADNTENNNTTPENSALARIPAPVPPILQHRSTSKNFNQSMPYNLKNSSQSVRSVFPKKGELVALSSSFKLINPIPTLPPIKTSVRKQHASVAHFYRKSGTKAQAKGGEFRERTTKK